MVTTQVALTTTYIAYGLNPSWTEQTSVSSPPGDPASTGTGVSVLDTVVALLRVQLRERPGYQRARVWIPAGGVQDSTLYTVTINGIDWDYTSDASATEAEILNGLQAAIDAGAAPVTTSQETWEGKNVIRLESDNAPPTETTFTVAVSAGGSGTIDSWIEPTTVTFDVWGTAKSLTLPVMDQLEDFVGISATKNWMQRVECAGLTELLLVPTATDGDVRLFVGPCIEST